MLPPPFLPCVWNVLVFHYFGYYYIWFFFCSLYRRSSYLSLGSSSDISSETVQKKGGCMSYPAQLSCFVSVTKLRFALTFHSLLLLFIFCVSYWWVWSLKKSSLLLICFLHFSMLQRFYKDSAGQETLNIIHWQWHFLYSSKLIS